MADFNMPSLGADMEAGTLVEWLVKPGDAVKRGDLVAVVETDKGAMEIEFFEDGVIEDLLVAPDTRVPVGTPLATFRPATTEPVPVPVPETAVAPPPQPAPKPAPAPAPEPPPAPTSTLRASPAARARAAALGVDLSTLSGSGPDGAIVLSDVEATPTPPDPRLAMRRAIAAAMSRSNREIPHYYLATDIDLSTALSWLDARNADRPVAERVLYAALLVKAVARACKKYPDLNGSWQDDRFVPSERVHVGVAISLRGGGLVAPAIHDADTLSLDAIMAALNDLVERARHGRLRNTEMSDPTITVTNLGAQGVPEVFPIITPPQVAMVGFGRVEERPWVVDGAVVPRPILRASLAADHRASDGHVGGLFLRTVERLLAAPQKLEE